MEETMTQRELERDFSRKTINALTKNGIRIYNKTWLPDESGDYINGQTGYIVDDNGTSKVLTFSQIYIWRKL